MVISFLYSMSLRDRNARGDAGDFHARVLQLLRELSYGGFAFDAGIGGMFAFWTGKPEIAPR